MAESRDRIDALTGIRIIAAGSVFLSHVEAPPFLPRHLRTFMAAGYNGVTLFFILSGFVLAWNYADRMARFDGKAIRSFAVARVARIYPLYLFALLFAAAPTLLFAGSGAILRWRDSPKVDPKRKGALWEQKSIGSAGSPAVSQHLRDGRFVPMRSALTVTARN